MTLSMELTAAPESWRALVVENEPDSLDLLVTFLELHGAHPLGVDDSRKGLEAVDAFQPNLILLDLSMPDLDGWELQRLLRARPALDDVPIIAVTALVMPPEQMRVQDAGFDGYITKPYRIGTLAQRIQKIIEQFQTRKR